MSKKPNQPRHPGKVSYRDHNGVILNNGRAIMDTDTGETYESPLHWVYKIDVDEGRKPPAMFSDCSVPPRKESSQSENEKEVIMPLRQKHNIHQLDDELLFELEMDFCDEDNTILKRPMSELIKDMDESMAELQMITHNNTKKAPVYVLPNTIVLH